MGSKNSGRRPFKTEEEKKQTQRERMLRYYYNKKEKALVQTKLEKQRLVDSLKVELSELFFNADMDNIDVNTLEDVKEIKLNRNYNIQVLKLGDSYLWRYKNIISDLLPRDKVLKDAKRALI